MNPSSKHNNYLADVEKEPLWNSEMERHQTKPEDLDKGAGRRFPIGDHDKPREAGPSYCSVGQNALRGIAILLILLTTMLVTARMERDLQRKELAELSNANHGATLEEFVANVRGEGEVCYALFDDDGNKLFEYMEDYYGLGMYEQPDWPDAEKLFGLAKCAQISTEIHWHPQSVPTSILDDIYVSAQVKSKQLIIMDYNRTHYFRPRPDGWPEVAEMLNFQRWNSRNPFGSILDRNYFEEMLEHFDIQHEVLLVE